MAQKDMLKIALVIALSASASTAFATSQIISSAITIGNSSFSPSTMVTITAAASSSAYSIFASHTNGNRLYWGGSTNSRVYYSTKDTTSTAPAAATTDDKSATAGWSSL